jgi:hypothetical protein
MEENESVARVLSAPLVFLVLMFCSTSFAADDSGYLGIKVCDHPNLVITEILPGGPAEQAGLRVGDRILAVGSESNVGDIRDDLRDFGPGNPVLLRVKRDGKEMEIPIMLAALPARPMPQGSTVFIPLPYMIGVRPGDPLADFECKTDCHVGIPPCDPVQIDGQGSKQTIAHWKGKIIIFKEDLVGRTFLDKESCEKVLKGCDIVL